MPHQDQTASKTQDCFSKVNRCPLCGEEKQTDIWKICKDPRFRLSSYGPPSNTIWSEIDTIYVVRCVGCGTRYRTEEISRSGVDATYTEEYHNIHTGHKWTGEWDRRLKSILLRVSGGRILDVGCGYGFFLSLAEPYFECVGVEISPAAAQKAKEMYGLEVHTGTLEEVGFPDAFFDVITLWDVIEHISEPNHLLYEINRIIKSGGLLCLCTGNMSSPLARLLGKHWSYYRLMDHVSFYNLDLLQILLQQNGFEITETFIENNSWKHGIQFMRYALLALVKYSLANINSLFQVDSLAKFLKAKAAPSVPEFGTQLVIIAEKIRNVESGRT